MSRVARLEGGVVVEILSAPEGMLITDCFHPTVLATCTPCNADVAVGWVYQDGALFDPENPPLPPEVVEPVEPIAEVAEEVVDTDPAAE